MQQDAGPIVTVTSSPGSASFFGTFGQFEQVSVTAFGQPTTVLPTLLQGRMPLTPGPQAWANYSTVLGQGMSLAGAPPVSLMLLNTLVVALGIFGLGLFLRRRNMQQKKKLRANRTSFKKR